MKLVDNIIASAYTFVLLHSHGLTVSNIKVTLRYPLIFKITMSQSLLFDYLIVETAYTFKGIPVNLNVRKPTAS